MIFLFWSGVLGFFAFFINYKKIKYKQIVFLVSALILSAFLVLYYGSWEFHDNPDPTRFTIGNSYTRYWLPVYLVTIPFAAFFLEQVLDSLKKILNFSYLEKKSKKFFSIYLRGKLLDLFLIFLVLGVYIFSSLNFVIHGSEEGLMQTAQRQIASQNEYERLLELTETNSVVITKYHDKLLFPDRKVIVGLFDDKRMNAIYSRLSEELPVYYYNFSFPEEDFNYLNERRLKESGLKISLVEKINTNFSLYKLEKIY